MTAADRLRLRLETARAIAVLLRDGCEADAADQVEAYAAGLGSALREITAAAPAPLSPAASEPPADMANKVWTQARDALLAERWPEGASAEDLLVALNTLPGRPIATAKAVAQRIAKLGLRRRPEIAQAARAANAAAGRAVRPAPPPPRAVTPRLISPAEPAPPPARSAAPPAPMPNGVQRMLRDGYGFAAIAARTGIPAAAVEDMIEAAEAEALDLLRAGSASTEEISERTYLPPGRLRELRATLPPPEETAA